MGKRSGATPAAATTQQQQQSLSLKDLNGTPSVEDPFSGATDLSSPDQVKPRPSITDHCVSGGNPLLPNLLV